MWSSIIVSEATSQVPELQCDSRFSAKAGHILNGNAFLTLINRIRKFMKSFSARNAQKITSNAAGTSNWSPANNFTVGISGPTLTSPDNGSTFYVGSTLNFAWTAISGSTSYDLEIDAGTPSAFMTNVTGLNYNQLLTAANSGQHNWHVRANFNTTAGTWSSSQSYSVLDKPASPSAI